MVVQPFGVGTGVSSASAFPDPLVPMMTRDGAPQPGVNRRVCSGVPVDDVGDLHPHAGGGGDVRGEAPTAGDELTGAFPGDLVTQVYPAGFDGAAGEVDAGQPPRPGDARGDRGELGGVAVPGQVGDVGDGTGGEYSTGGGGGLQPFPL
jgi:hypothetical protein